MSSTRKHIAIREIGEVVIVNFLEQELIGTTLAIEIGMELFAIAEQEFRGYGILLNFSGVTCVDEYFLTKLITLDKKLKSAGPGYIRMCFVHPEIHEVLAITKLNRIFRICDDEHAALSDF